MDPQSLDVAVQTTLSGLFPPFEATAPTVLGQLFRVLEAKYHGDGLCCLLDFLVPSKRLLEDVRQAACAPYVSRVFLHEGWPLCLHEKVVVHLGPLNPLLLRPGDFYLQAEPCGDQSACLSLKCLSRDLTSVQKIPVPEASCPLLFTQEWLEEINQGLDQPVLHTCLVATENGIVPVPWSKIVTPEFVQLPKSKEREAASDYLETYSLPKGGTDRSPRSTQGKYPGLIKVEQGTWKQSNVFLLPSLCDIISENLEGEYVNLLGFSEEKKLDSSSPAKSTASRTHQEVPGEESPGMENGVVEEIWSCAKGPDSEEGPCTPCLRRKLNQDPKVHEPKCRYRESYVAALKNPVSFSSGLMEAILEEIDTTQQAPESVDTISPRDPVSRISLECLDKESKAEEVPKPKPLKVLKSPPEGPAASNRFSFLKGYRHPVLPTSPTSPEKVGKGQEGPRKRNVCSPKASRGKMASSGKGTNQVDVVFPEQPSLKRIENNTAGVLNLDSLVKELQPPGPGPWDPVRWESLNTELLSSGLVCLPGNTDKAGRPIIHIRSGPEWSAPWCSASEVLRLLLYLFSLSRKWSSEATLTVVIDARKDPLLPPLSAALAAFQKALPGSIHTVLLLAEKEAASHLEKLPGVQVELLSNLKALTRFVDGSQLTQTLDGQFPYCHGEWVQYFQKLHHFVNDLTKASELLRSAIKELERSEVPETFQAVQQQMQRHRQLMQEVLSDVRLEGLQREGGATLARLRREAVRLSPSPDVRMGIEWALALYSLLEDQVHSLVTKSNSRSGRLEFLLKIRELEGEFSKVSLWFEEKGEPELLAVGSAAGSREIIEESYRRFKEFFKEATVHYNRGLSLSKDAAKIQGSSFPEMGAFEAAKRSFQAKLTTFYMEMERTGAELETLLDLHRFGDKVTQFSLDCKLLLVRSASKGNALMNANAQQEVEELLQRLSGEFSAETFQQMKIQASSLSNRNGLTVWREALERCQEAKRTLQGALGRFKEEREKGSFDSIPEVHGLDEDPGLDGVSREQERKVNSDKDGFANTIGVSNHPSVEIGKEREETYLDSLDPVLEHGPSKNDEGGFADTVGIGEHPSDPAHGGTGKGSEETYLDPILEYGNPEAQDLDAEISDGLHVSTQSLPSIPLDFSLKTCEKLPSAKQPCASMPARGRSRRRTEAAQYFQLSRHESFSSEDADSQNSAEDTLGSSTLSMESPNANSSCAQEKSLGILYLENHNAQCMPNAATQ
ncbi:uncharacterized protein KIAA1755 homolog [Anolis carolinensis]|uniref:uncharacterized protein KIAA1755 homolog n=1 Tax=Anolis carolinensis TaxID=28377 RepID=UPI002F2B65FA